MSNEHSTQTADSPLDRGDMFAYQRLIRDADLSSNARHVLHVLTGYADRDGGSCRPPVKRLSHDTGLCDRAVRSATKELRERGWLAVVARGGFRDGKNFATVYRLTVGRMVEGGGLHEVQDLQEVQGGPAGGAGGVLHEVQDGPAGGAGYLLINQPINQPIDPPINASDAPPRRCTPAADATGEAIARAVAESDHDSNTATNNAQTGDVIDAEVIEDDTPDANSDHGPCAACGQRSGRVEVLHNRTGKAHLFGSLSPAQRKTYPHATVIRYCLPCAHRAPHRGWWTHTTPAESVA